MKRETAQPRSITEHGGQKKSVDVGAATCCNVLQHATKQQPARTCVLLAVLRAAGFIGQALLGKCYDKGEGLFILGDGLFKQ